MGDKKNILKQQKGAALIAVLAISSLLLIFVQEVWKDSQLEYSSSYNRLLELKSRYSARSGADLALLRIHVYKELSKVIEGNEQVVALAKPYLDRVWLDPFVWPFLAPQESLSSVKKDLKDLNKQSFLKESYNSKLFPEDGRIDLNDLSSPIDYIQTFTYDTLLNFLKITLEKTPKLEDEYEDQLKEIVNNISDWTDLDKNSKNGGSEERVEEGKVPLNRSFHQVDEIQKVPGVTKDIFNLLKDHVTVYGVKGININYASREVLQALNISELVADEILSRTDHKSKNYAPFSDIDSFCEFISSRGLLLCDNLINVYGTRKMLKFNTASHFRVVSTGTSRQFSSYLEALFYDPIFAIENYKKTVKIQEGIYKGEGDAPKKEESKADNKTKKKLKIKIPREVASIPFFIMYWKEKL